MGPIGVLSVIALIVVLGVGYWIYRVIERPVVDVFIPGVRE